MPISTYCTVADIQNRLSIHGLGDLLDHNHDSSLDDSETTAVFELALQAAGGTVDQALARWIGSLPLVQSEDKLNPWLRERALALAVEWVAAQQGREVPASLRRAADRAREDLRSVALGHAVVPGLATPQLDRRGPRVVSPT